MKIKELHTQLSEVAKRLDIEIRRDNGSFKSGYAIVNDMNMIVLNRNTPLETICVAIAKAIAAHDTDNLFIPPAVREFIEESGVNTAPDNEFSLVVNY